MRRVVNEGKTRGVVVALIISDLTCVPGYPKALPSMALGTRPLPERKTSSTNDASGP